MSEINELDREWRLLRNTVMESDVTDDMTQFWFKVGMMKRGDDTAMFPLVSKLMKSLLCLPHSSAAVERVFSQVNLMKTKMRNQLNTSTLIGMLHAKDTYKSASCHDFKIKSTHLKRMTAETLYHGISED